MKVLAFLILSVLSVDSIATGCASPAGVAGQIQYIAVDMKFCDGTTWQSMTVSNTGVACAVTAGTLTKSGTDLRFCNGTNWISVNGSTTGSSCSIPGIVTWNSSQTSVEWCDGTNWHSTVAAANAGKPTATSPTSVSIGNTSHDIAISPDSAHVYAADTSDSLVKVFSRNSSTSLLTNVSSVSVSQPWSVAVSPDGANVYVGLRSGAIAMFSRNASTGALTPLSPATISGGGLYPSYSTVSPDGGSFYSVEDSTGSNITQFKRNTSTGLLTILSPATVVTANGPSELYMTSDSNNLMNTGGSSGNLYMFTRNASTGALTAVSYGTTGAQVNRYAMSADSKFLFASTGSAVAVYSANYVAHTFTLASSVTLAAAAGASSASPDGKSFYVYTANSTIAAYDVNSTSGALTAQSPAAVSTAASYIQKIIVSPDNKSVYALDQNGAIYMYQRQ